MKILMRIDFCFGQTRQGQYHLGKNCLDYHVELRYVKDSEDAEHKLDCWETHFTGDLLARDLFYYATDSGLQHLQQIPDDLRNFVEYGKAFIHIDAMNDGYLTVFCETEIPFGKSWQFTG